MSDSGVLAGDDATSCDHDRPSSRAALSASSRASSEPPWLQRAAARSPGGTRDGTAARPDARSRSATGAMMPIAQQRVGCKPRATTSEIPLLPLCNMRPASLNTATVRTFVRRPAAANQSRHRSLSPSSGSRARASACAPSSRRAADGDPTTMIGGCSKSRSDSSPGHGPLP